MKKIAISLIVVMCFCLFQSCRKNGSTDLDPNVNVSNDVIISLSSYTGIFDLLIKARLNPTLQSTGFAYFDGVNVSYDSVNKVYRFGFGTSISPDSVQRTGWMTIVVSGDILLKGSYAKVSYQDYFEDGGKVLGNDSIANEGVNSLNQMVFSVHVSQGTIMKAITKITMTVNLSCTYKTPISALFSGSDLHFLVQGKVSGLSSKGHSFSANIRDTLVNSFSCPWLNGGVIDVDVSDATVPSCNIDFTNKNGCSDVIWYYCNGAEFKVLKNQYYLKN